MRIEDNFAQNEILFNNKFKSVSNDKTVEENSNSIGFGDYYPITIFGKVLVSLQALFFLSFVILFLNFFSTKVKSKGYFDDEEI